MKWLNGTVGPFDCYLNDDNHNNTILHFIMFNNVSFYIFTLTYSMIIVFIAAAIFEINCNQLQTLNPYKKR